MNILILSGSTGGGHNRASNALKSYILSQDENHTVNIVDSLEYCSTVLNKTVTIGYNTLVKKTPELFGVFYKTTDKESAISLLVDTVMKQFAKKHLPLLEELKPDIIISCHPFVSNMMSCLKENYDVDIPVISIITDFMPHKAYIGNYIDAYITASQETADNLAEKYNVEKSRIFPLGIPVFQSFYNRDERRAKETIQRLGFSPDKPIILLMAGSFGVTDVLKIYEKMLDIDYDFQIVVITGKNKKLYDAFEKMLNRNIEEFETYDISTIIPEQNEANIFDTIYEHIEEVHKELNTKLKKTFKRSTTKTKPTKLFYFIDNVDDYMHVADLIITKPGGLTTSESLACGLPMAVFKAYPGQEAQNADFLVNKQAAIILEKGDAMKQQLYDLLNDKERLNMMKENSKNCARTNSSECIYNLIKEIYNSRNTN